MLVAVGLALIGSIAVSLTITIFGYDSLAVPRGLGAAANAFAAVLLVLFVVLIGREIRRNARRD